MPDLTEIELHHLRAAEGWMELGLPAEAWGEIGHIAPQQQEHPLTLEVRWRIHAEQGQWEDSVRVAEALVQAQPENVFGWIHRSYALHELKRTREAAELLRPALKNFPKEELIPYNLACYACQFGDLEQARALLEAAAQRGNAKEIKARALHDPDLAPLRDFIRQW